MATASHKRVAKSSSRKFLNFRKPVDAFCVFSTVPVLLEIKFSEPYCIALHHHTHDSLTSLKYI